MQCKWLEFLVSLNVAYRCNRVPL